MSGPGMIEDRERRAGLLSIVMPVLDNLELTRTSCEALYEHTGSEFELILIDNASRQDVGGFARDLAARRGNVIHLTNEINEGFGFACNQGFAAAHGELVALLNNDVVVTAGWLERMRAVLLADPRIALVGPRTNRASGPQVVKDASYDGLAGLAAFAARWGREHAGECAFLPRIVGLCVLLRHQLLDEIGGFDPCFWLGNFEDDDLCLRALRRGYRLAVANDVFVHHHGSATWRRSNIDYTRLMHENWSWFCHKWDYEGRLGPYPATRMALAQAYDPERDHVPYRPGEVCTAAAAPLELDGARATRLLVFADPWNEGWQGVLNEYARSVPTDAPLTLVLRVEPPTDEVIDQVVLQVEEVVAGLGKAEEELPDILLETSRIFPRRRGGLYTAASALVDAGGARAHLYRREAEACGLRTITDLADLAPGLVPAGAEARP